MAVTGSVRPRRAAVVAGLVTLLALSVSAPAQPPGRVPKLGYLTLNRVSPAAGGNLGTFLAALRDLGWVDGQTLAIVYRDGGGQAERLPAAARELADLKVDVILAFGSVDVRAALGATRTIPIVMGPYVPDPVGHGFVANLARPGGNVTGVTSISAELKAKRFQLLKELRPGLAGVALLWDLALGSVGERERVSPGYDEGARALGLALAPVPVREPKDIDPAFETIRKAGAGAVMLGPDTAFLRSQLPRIAELALRHRVLTMGQGAHNVAGGLLMSYDPSVAELIRRAAAYVDRILKGTRPADLPVEQPTRFEFVLNLRTAKALGLQLPEAIRVRVDRVIE